MSLNTNLHLAKKAKNDEFYTRYEDIEKELEHYKEHFKGKVVYCNCDSTESNFWKFFIDVFSEYGLKGIIATNVKNGELVRYDGDEPVITQLPCNGDFRSEACIELLKEADIVVTNPPFSLFREFVAQLIQYDKKFLIIGNKNAITYKEIFPLLKENRIWLGYGSPAEFGTPDNGITKQVNGLCRWFTNLDIQKRHERLDLRGNYYYGNEDKYPKYDNYDAINVDKVADIPSDYFEAIGVPITFLDKFCPEQFEIVGYSREVATPIEQCVPPENIVSKGGNAFYLNGGGGTGYTDELSSVEWIPINKSNRDKAMKLVEEYGFLYRNGVMGVPITFLDKYCPEQFDIVGLTQRGCHDDSMELKRYDDYVEMKPDGTPTGSSGSKTNGNPNLQGNDMKHNYFVNKDGHIVQSCYQRIFVNIRR